jgi:hypothetical protein
MFAFVVRLSSNNDSTINYHPPTNIVFNRDPFFLMVMLLERHRE